MVFLTKGCYPSLPSLSSYIHQLIHRRALLHILHQTLVHKVHILRRPLSGGKSGRCSITNQFYDLCFNSFLFKHLRRALSGKRVLPISQFNQRNAKRPYITLQLRHSIEHFRSDIPRGSTLCWPSAGRALQLNGQREITEFHQALLGKKHIQRLDVLISDPSIWHSPCG